MNTNDSLEVKNNRAKKMMLWFGMISMSMTFAGLTSAYVVSSSGQIGFNKLSCLLLLPLVRC